MAKNWTSVERDSAKGSGLFPGLRSQLSRHTTGAPHEAEADNIGIQVAMEGSTATAGPLQPGGTLPLAVRQTTEHLLGRDFSSVRVHADAEGDSKARGAGAYALTEGEHVYMPPWAYQPAHPLSRGLIAHELTHVAQQRLGRRRDEDSARDAFLSGRGRENALRALAADQESSNVAQRWARLETGRRGLSPAAPGMQQRCVAGCKSCEKVDPVKEKKERIAELDATISNPASGFGQIAAAKAERMDVAHDIQLLETGQGTHVGNKAADLGQNQPSPPKKTDCTEYTVQVLRETFAAQGQGAAFAKILKNAQKSSGGDLKGTKLIEELHTAAGWKVVYWNPDSKFIDKKASGADDTEHKYSADVARKSGTYYGIPLEKDKMVVNYQPKPGTGTTKDTRAFDRLKRVPFGVLTARGGLHMAMLVSGTVFEVHFKAECTSSDVFEATPLEKWAWLSGAVAAPAADIDAAWK